MENKKFRHIVTVIWGMCFCINLIICLWASDPHPISWIITGMMLGGAFIMLLNNSLMNVQEELINILTKANKKYAELFNKIFKALNKDKSKKKKK